MFWFCIGLAYNLIILLLFDMDIAIVWFNGYILEYTLSVDNVFFFHVVFQAYSTPNEQTYRALFFGIVGAGVLRLLFYVVGSSFFRLAWVVQIVFGFILVWSAYKTAGTDDDDDDPRENRIVQMMTKCLPFSDRYDEDGRLFIVEEEYELDALENSSDHSCLLNPGGRGWVGTWLVAQTLEGPFLAVPKPIFATKDSFYSNAFFRDLRD